MSEFVLPYTQFVGVRSSKAQESIVENLLVLEAWLAEAKIRDDIGAIAARVGEFRNQVEGNTPKREEPVGKGRLRKLRNGLGAAAAFRMDMASELRQIAREVNRNGGVEATFTWQLKDGVYERGSVVGALLGLAEELHS